MYIFMSKPQYFAISSYAKAIFTPKVIAAEYKNNNHYRKYFRYINYLHKQKTFVIDNSNFQVEPITLES